MYPSVLSFKLCFCLQGENEEDSDEGATFRDCCPGVEIPSQGELGELLIGGLGVAEGYHHRPVP